MERFEVGSQDYIDEVFQYHAPDALQCERFVEIRQGAKDFAAILAANVPASADRSDAFRKLRECVHMANASVALHGRA